jgi:hypothetical protein
MEIALVAALMMAAVAVVLRPLLRRDAGAPDPTTTPDGDVAAKDRALAAEVARYRTALRAGTVCKRCKEANPPGSRFCADCGRALAPNAASRPRRDRGEEQPATERAGVQA